MTAHRKARGGRPKGLRPPLALVSFRADENVLTAIVRLTRAAMAEAGMAPGHARSFALRRAILAAAQALDDEPAIQAMADEERAADERRRARGGGGS